MKLLNLKDDELQILIFDRRSQQDLKNAVPMKGRYIHPLKGKGYVQPYSSHSDQVTFFLIV
jgi:hypothetical protein